MLKGTFFRFILIFYVILVYANSSIAATKIDSLRQIWTNTTESDDKRFSAIKHYYDLFTTAQPDSSFEITNYHYNLAKEKNHKREMSRAFNEKAHIFYIRGDIKNSRAMLKKSIDLYEKFNDHIGLASLHANLGNLYGEENIYQEAVKHFSRSLKIFQEGKSGSGEAHMLNSLGLVYYYIDSYDLSLEYLHKSLEVYKDLGAEEKKGSIWNNIGAVYFEKNMYDEAVDYFEKGLEIAQKTKNLPTETDSYFFLAKSSRKSNQIERATQYAEKSLEIAKVLNNNSNIIERLTFIADLTFDKDVNAATKLAKNIYTLIDEDTNNELKVNLFELLYKCYKANGDINLSLEMHEKYVLYNDSLQIEKNNLVLTREAIEKEYEAKLNESKINSEQAQAQLKSNHFRKTSVIVLIGFGLIGLILFIARSRILSQRKHQETLLAEIEQLKKAGKSSITLQASKFQLDRTKIEQTLGKKVNETDWNVLNILLDDPVISNKGIAEKAFMSVDGIGSSLRRMYVSFDIKESKYKKISLIMKAIKLSNN